jgi:hypothetical protein
MLRLIDEKHCLAMRERLAKSVALLAKELREGPESRPERMIEGALHERKLMAAEIEGGMFGRNLHGPFHQGYETELINGFYVERRVIHQFLDRGEITVEQANALRGDVNRLELYMLSEKHGEDAPMVKMFAKMRCKMTRRHR